MIEVGDCVYQVVPSIAPEGAEWLVTAIESAKDGSVAQLARLDADSFACVSFGTLDETTARKGLGSKALLLFALRGALLLDGARRKRGGLAPEPSDEEILAAAVLEAEVTAADDDVEFIALRLRRDIGRAGKLRSRLAVKREAARVARLEVAS